jgi:hypothetical protein
MDAVKQIWDRLSGMKTNLLLMVFLMADIGAQDGWIAAGTAETLTTYLIPMMGLTASDKVNRLVKAIKEK